MYIFSPKFAQVFCLVFSLKILMQVNTHRQQNSNIHKLSENMHSKIIRTFNRL